MSVGGILTAMVTPFDANGGLAEERAAELMRHLLDHGSDGVVLAGTTGEGATLTDEEMFRLWEIGVEACGDATVIAGTGTNDTRALGGADRARHGDRRGRRAVRHALLQQAEPGAA